MTDADILAMRTPDLFAEIGASPAGLGSWEAATRLVSHGPNVLARRKKRTAAVRFLSYFKSPLVILLIMAGAVTIVVGEVVNAVIIYVMVVMSVALGFYQESKAEGAAEALRKKVHTTASVVRDGRQAEIPVSEIVPGDLVRLSAGDIVPADGRVLQAKDLFVDQSALTGESFPAEKVLLARQSGSPLERPDCVFMGTSVVSGTGEVVVAKTGPETEYGRIAGKLVAKRPETEFDRRLRHFGYLIMQVTFLLVIFVFFVNTFFHRGVLESLLFAVALAVGLTPELLPMIVTINLSKGAMAMADRGVVVRRLASIQNFGSMDVLCTDKTGTLTENVITLVLHVDIDGHDDDQVLLYSYLNSRFQTGLRSPLDVAILKHTEVDVSNYLKADEIPFDFNRKRLSVAVDRAGERFLVTKGAPEETLKICDYYANEGRVIDLTPEIAEQAMKKYAELSSGGFRVLAVAHKRIRQERAVYGVADESGMVFLGFDAFLDPPKRTAKESLALLAEAGIKLKILTGDNELVTGKICEQLEIKVGRIVSGDEIARADDDALSRLVEDANVFARVNPGQKDRIMSALKRNGHVVGFLGDGINDAASIRTADVGISVENAVDVAREAADIILLRTDLTVLQRGVVEGRRTFGNTMKYVMMGTSSSFGNMFSAAGASVFLPFLPMLPAQILLNNLLYDFSELAIPSDNVDDEYARRPRRWEIGFVREFMAFFGPISSLFDFLTFAVLIFVFAAGEQVFQTAWFLESLSTQTLVIFVIRTSRTPFYRSRPSRLLTASTLAVVAVAFLLPFTPIGTIIGLAPPPAAFWPVLAAFIGSYLFLAECLKRFFYRRLARRNGGA